MFKPLQLVEVAGTPEEGFPSSWVIGTIVESKGAEGAKVQYLEVRWLHAAASHLAGEATQQ
jgi:hypothetical protein